MHDYRIGHLKGGFVVVWNDPDGKRRRYRLAAATLKDAAREARDLILRKTAPPAGVTVEALWSGYQEAMQGRRQARKLAQTGRQLLPHLGHLAALQISPQDCRAYIARRTVDGLKPASIRTELGCLRAALLWAHKARLIDRAPEIELPATPRPRERYLTRGEVAALVGAASAPHIQLALLLMLHTAGRIGAILELKWDRVDLDRRVIRLAANDIGPRKGRATVPITDTLAAALQTARAAALSPYVVEWGGRQVKSIKTGFASALRNAGIAHCTPHDLRRTAGRFMVEAGVPIEEVAQYMGHSNTTITRSTYAQFSPDHLRRAADALDLAAGFEVQRTTGKPRKRPPTS